MPGNQSDAIPGCNLDFLDVTETSLGRRDTRCGQGCGMRKLIVGAMALAGLVAGAGPALAGAPEIQVPMPPPRTFPIEAPDHRDHELFVRTVIVHRPARGNMVG